MKKNSKGKSFPKGGNRNTSFKGGKRYNNRGKSGSSRPEGRDEDFAGNVKSAENDIAWYSRNPELLAASANFPFPYRPGMSIPVLSTDAPNAVKLELGTGWKIPGVMTIDWIPSLGKATSATDPINIAAKEIYSKVRSKFSGSLDADAPDFIVYLMALDSIFAYIATLKRIYRIIDAWSPNNYQTPDTLLYAMGFTPGEIQGLRENKVQLWQYINELVLMSRKFTCPAKMDIFNRHYWLSDNVYTDAPSINSQFYMFNMVGTFHYENVQIPGTTPAAYAAGLAITTVPWCMGNRAANITPTIMFNHGRLMINKLVAWDDAYTINGYLQRAYEDAPQFIVDELPQGQPFSPVYEPEVLLQIENAHAIPNGVRMCQNPGTFNFTGFLVSQSPESNTVNWNPKYTLTSTTDYCSDAATSPYYKELISIRSERPDPKDVVIATRLKAQVTGTYDDGFIIDSATEIPMSIRVIKSVPANATFVTPWLNGLTLPQTPFFGFTGASTFAQIKPYIDYTNMVNEVESFDWHPFSFSYVRDSANNTYYWSPCGDIANATAVSDEDIANLHRVCVLSEINAFDY